MMFGGNRRSRPVAQAVYAAMLWTVILFLSIAAAQAGQVTLAWNASSGATGYQVHYGTSSGNYTTNVNVGNTTSHTLTLADGATYYFAVKAYNSAGNQSAFSNEVSKTLTAVAPAPVANFSATPTSGTAPLTVQFADSSTNATAWSWNFGDNTSSAIRNPSKTYSSAGTYTVSLTATGAGGSNTRTRTSYISVTAPPTTTAPTANFTASPTSGSAPLLVNLADTSTGSISSRSWNFGDGTSTTVSSAQTFVKSYAYRSTPYTVSLTVTGSGVSHTKTQTISATATAPVANFSASPTSGVAPLATTFTNTSTGTITGYAWDFGDGSTSTAQNPAKTYASAGAYTVKLTATGPAGSNTKTGSVTVTAASASTGGLVAAYNFAEASGNTVVDASGNGNHGTISGATRTSSGKFGRALSFDGVDDWVTVNDSNSLDLTTGMTLQAWVYPTTTMSGWRNVLLKERTGGLAYGLYANSDTNRPVASINVGGDKNLPGVSALTANTWVHLAATYDGVTQRLYVNGKQVASRAQTGNMPVSTGALRIGGNSVWGEYFQGRIDEVRVHNRALSATEIQTDMTSLPPTRLVGDPPTGTTIGTKTDPISKGTAKAFLKKADKTGTVTSLSVYVVSGSTALVAGLYTNDSSSGKNRPGTLLAQGTLSSPKAGTWNHVSLPAETINAGTTYWIAILSPGGELQISDRVNGGTQPSETGPYTTRSTLPSTWWSTGVTPSADGPVAGYGAGYGR